MSDREPTKHAEQVSRILPVISIRKWTLPRKTQAELDKLVAKWIPEESQHGE